MTGGVVYLLDADAESLNGDYVSASPLDSVDGKTVRDLLEQHFSLTQSWIARELLNGFNPARFVRVKTCVKPVFVDEPLAIEFCSFRFPRLDWGWAGSSAPNRGSWRSNQH